jgi:hypothetical protein
MKRRKRVKKMPTVHVAVRISTIEAWKICQEEGSKS